jgi:protein CpxP
MAQLGPIMRLDLTEAQRAQVRSLVESRQAETKATMDRGRAVHEALQAAVTSDTFDEGTVRARHADVAAVEAEMAVARARLHADVLQILTPEQRAQLKEWQAQRGKRDSR